MQAIKRMSDEICIIFFSRGREITMNPFLKNISGLILHNSVHFIHENAVAFTPPIHFLSLNKTKLPGLY